MSRPPTLGPPWLVDLIHQWVRRSLRHAERGLGYPSICVMLKIGLPRRMDAFSYYEPTGYGQADFTDVEESINALTPIQKHAVLRYFMPWTAKVIDEEYPRDTDSWLYYLKQALAVLAKELDRKALQAYSA